MNVIETLNELGFGLIDTDDRGSVYGLDGVDYNLYVNLPNENEVIQVCKIPEDEEQFPTIIHFNRNCEEIVDLLRKWSNVTPAVSN